MSLGLSPFLSTQLGSCRLLSQADVIPEGESSGQLQANVTAEQDGGPPPTSISGLKKNKILCPQTNGYALLGWGGGGGTLLGTPGHLSGRMIHIFLRVTWS